ncbi:hypothetical protein HZS_1212 [Henneguya salminicola]|nr:hypothetical protein HZS_1212 [Henneguya salminicola]
MHLLFIWITTESLSRMRYITHTSIDFQCRSTLHPFCLCLIAKCFIKSEYQWNRTGCIVSSPQTADKP